MDLDNYYIKSVSYYCERIFSTEVYNNSEEDQDLAFAMMQDILEDIERENGSARGGVTKVIGPTRVIVHLRERKTADRKIVLAAISYTGPHKDFCASTVRGYEISVLGMKVNPLCLKYIHSNTHFIHKLEYFYPSGSTLHNFYGEDERGWSQVERLCGKLSETEIQAIKTWRPGISSQKDSNPELDICSGMGGGGFYGATHKPYKPPIASFRVSGDEIGAQLYLGQMKRRVKEKRSNLAEVLDSPEKKMVAEEKSNQSSHKKASAKNKTGGNSQPSRALCVHCNVSNCDVHSQGAYCEELELWEDYGKWIH